MSDQFSSGAYNLACKLEDAGLSSEQAVGWVREILAEAWDEGWFAGVRDTRCVPENPYEPPSPV